jgi:hypothetical protein
MPRSISVGIGRDIALRRQYVKALSLVRDRFAMPEIVTARAAMLLPQVIVQPPRVMRGSPLVAPSCRVAAPWRPG